MARDLEGERDRRLVTRPDGFAAGWNGQGFFLEFHSEPGCDDLLMFAVFDTTEGAGTRACSLRSGALVL